ncbi:hypothetical protein P691DRAFT_776345 [Macrolepiota fuliginosa MF-IS2]|uniref:Uncharacterized protein n=1 Tax=Macrolepiota fuliginosa MF-IS2 TaxID=1400762 RepID=A0A9P5X967_9AGAR|nr:hypothetical protein P691DRAFT_776345 [Macrolepiota fuliginosa MF-IS2]
MPSPIPTEWLKENCAYYQTVATHWHIIMSTYSEEDRLRGREIAMLHCENEDRFPKIGVGLLNMEGWDEFFARMHTVCAAEPTDPIEIQIVYLAAIFAAETLFMHVVKFCTGEQIKEINAYAHSISTREAIEHEEARRARMGAYQVSYGFTEPHGPTEDDQLLAVKDRIDQVPGILYQEFKYRDDMTGEILTRVVTDYGTSAVMGKWYEICLPDDTEEMKVPEKEMQEMWARRLLDE